MIRAFAYAIAALFACLGTTSARGEVDPAERTADMADSWLVVYNVNDRHSGLWAEWFAKAYGIPDENLLGLDASVNEHLANRASAVAQIIGPVRNYFSSNPELEQRIMGIVLGFRVPGHFGSPPVIPGVGGYSVAGALQDLYDSATWQMNPDCPHMVAPYGAMPTGGRLTKATMTPGHYMVTRIDGATIGDALSLTIRAQDLSNTRRRVFLGSDQLVWFDFLDPVIPGGEWFWLKAAVQSSHLADIPWSAFDADTQQSPNDAFRFSTHDIAGWNDERLRGSPRGYRVLAYNLNSWGATTVRSNAAEGGRYVPNALTAGYAASIGATGEPQCCVAPFPDTLLRALREEWTIAEAFYLANPYDNWMWSIIGDPFMVIHNMTSQRSLLAAPHDTEHSDGDVDLRDFAAFQGCFSGNVDAPDYVPPSSNCLRAFDHGEPGDGDVDVEDFDAAFRVMSGPTDPS